MLVDAIDKRPIEVELECGFDGHPQLFSKSSSAAMPASAVQFRLPSTTRYDASVSSLSSGLLLLSELHPSRGPNNGWGFFINYALTTSSLDGSC